MKSQIEVEKSTAEAVKKVSLVEQLNEMKENDILIVPIVWEGQKDE